MATPTTSHDVVIVGGRCAGAATARLLAARGHDVVVVERGDRPATPCPPTASPAAAWSSWPAGGCSTRCSPREPRLREVTIGSRVSEDDRPLKDRAGVDLLVAPRRSTSTGSCSRGGGGRRGDAHRRPCAACARRRRPGQRVVARTATGGRLKMRGAARHRCGRPASSTAAQVRRPRSSSRSTATSRSTTPTSTRWPGAATSCTWATVVRRRLSDPRRPGRCLAVPPTRSRSGVRQAGGRRAEALLERDRRDCTLAGRRLRDGPGRGTDPRHRHRRPTTSATHTGPAGRSSVTPATTATR